MGQRLFARQMERLMLAAKQLLDYSIVEGGVLGEEGGERAMVFGERPFRERIFGIMEG